MSGHLCFFVATGQSARGNHQGGVIACASVYLAEIWIVRLLSRCRPDRQDRTGCRTKDFLAPRQKLDEKKNSRAREHSPSMTVPILKPRSRRSCLRIRTNTEKLSWPLVHLWPVLPKIHSVAASPDEQITGEQKPTPSSKKTFSVTETGSTFGKVCIRNT